MNNGAEEPTYEEDADQPRLQETHEEPTVPELEAEADYEADQQDTPEPDQVANELMIRHIMEALIGEDNSEVLSGAE